MKNARCEAVLTLPPVGAALVAKCNLCQCYRARFVRCMEVKFSPDNPAGICPKFYLWGYKELDLSFAGKRASIQRISPTRYRLEP